MRITQDTYHSILSLKYFFRANGLKDNLRSSLTFKHTSIRLHNKSENSERKSYGVTSVSYQKILEMH